MDMNTFAAKMSAAKSALAELRKCSKSDPAVVEAGVRQVIGYFEESALN